MAKALEDVRSPLAIDVRCEADVVNARRSARQMAASLGFPAQAGEEISISASELASNLVKHTAGGRITLRRLDDGGRVGMEIESGDDGPGIADVEQAFGDRYSTAGTRGTGLGAVNRLMDEMDIDTAPSRPTRINCRKWLRTYPATVRQCPLTFGVATRPRIFGQPNGDAFIVHHWAESTLVGIIDGLGHGQFAHRAAQTARTYVEPHFDLPFDQIFRGAGRACRATRGVVMALARFDWGRQRLTFASVGNVSARALPNPEAFRFAIRRGVIGLNAPSPVVTEHDWPPDHTFVLHSDGVSDKWSADELQRSAAQPAATVAQELLRSHGRREDDATVIVVKAATP